MRDACLRAIELGLPAVTFTDHADLTPLVVSDAAAEYIRAVGEGKPRARRRLSACVF